MAQPTVLAEPTQAMRDAVVRAEPHIATLARLAQDAKHTLPDLCMQIGVCPKGVVASANRIVQDDVMVASCSFRIFREMKLGNDPITRKLFEMENVEPGDMVLLVTTEDRTVFIGLAKKDFGVSPLALVGAL